MRGGRDHRAGRRLLLPLSSVTSAWTAKPGIDPILVEVAAALVVAGMCWQVRCKIFSLRSSGLFRGADL